MLSTKKLLAKHERHLFLSDESHVRQVNEHLKQFPFLKKNPFAHYRQTSGFRSEHVVQVPWHTANIGVYPTMKRTLLLTWASYVHTVLLVQALQYPGQILHSEDMA